MPISVVVVPARSVRIRALAQKHPYLTDIDIAKLTGERPGFVRLALGRSDEGKVKSRVPMER